MKFDNDLFSTQYLCVYKFVQGVAYYRALHKRLASTDTKSFFWGKTSDSFLETATIDWCKVFGSDNLNKIHWKKLIIDEKKKYNDLLRKRILTVTGSLEKWAEYHKEMCDFRNKYVAHIEVKNIPITPIYDKALEVAYAYDDWVRKDLKISLSYPFLKVKYSRFVTEAEGIVTKAINKA